MYHVRVSSSTREVTVRGRLEKPSPSSDATELYEVDRWGKGYFSISPAGHVLVHPTKDPARSIDLKQLTDHLMLRGIGLPVLIRFRDILRHRRRRHPQRFQAAITQHQYEGRYVCVYPIKVNQQRQVVEEVLDFGREYGFGLEAGSKPELLAVVAQAYNDTPIICNGFKDAEFIEMAMLAQKIGRNVIPVVEKYTELGLILKYAEQVGVRPQIGMRVKLAARGGGRWQGSGGYRSKFGLTVAEVLRGLEELQVARHAGLLQAPALPPRQPDSQHPHRQGRAERGGAHLHRAGQGGRGARVPRRRRRPRRRLRRLADQLRIERELHARGIRQRRRLPHPDGVRRRGREASDDRVGERPRDRRVPQRPDLQRPRRFGLRRGEDPGGRSRRTKRSSRSSICSRPTRTSPPGTRSRATTTPSRRSTWR